MQGAGARDTRRITSSMVRNTARNTPGAIWERVGRRLAHLERDEQVA